jgi:hypothetical protein
VVEVMTIVAAGVILVTTIATAAAVMTVVAIVTRVTAVILMTVVVTIVIAIAIAVLLSMMMMMMMIAYLEASYVVVVVSYCEMVSSNAHALHNSRGIEQTYILQCPSFILTISKTRPLLLCW